MTTRSTTGLPGTQAFILAGGRGERLFPLTALRPKPAIPFGGVLRIVDFTLSNCLNSRLSQVALLTQYRHDELHSYIRNNWSEFWTSSRPGGKPLICLPPTSGKHYRGTADAVFQNLPIIESNRGGNILILSGDHVYQMDYRELLAQHVETNADVTIATVEYPAKDASRFGVVEVDRDFQVTGFQEKPRNPCGMPLRPHVALISMGVYAFKTVALVRSLIENCDGAFGFDFGHHIIPSLIGSAHVYAFDFRDEIKNSPRYWRDIGTIDSYYEANMDFVRHGASFDPFKDGWLSRRGLLSQAAASVCGSAHVSQSVLSPGVRIEEGASVEKSVLMSGVHVGRGARLRRAIIEEDVQIPAGFQIGWDIEHDRKHYTVSAKGIVVVSETPKMSKPAPPRFVQEKTVLGFKPAEDHQEALNVP